MGAENHTEATEGHYAARKAIALRAYYEWMPIREPRAGLGLEAINRSFEFGDLATLAMVETRLTAREQAARLRDRHAEVNGVPDLTAFYAKLNAPDRDLLGDAQRHWLKARAGRVEGRAASRGRCWAIRWSWPGSSART